MKNPKAWLSVLGAALLVLVVPPLAGSEGDESGSQVPGLRIMVPNTPGGGYDITARTAAKTIEDNGLNGTTEVFNLPGAGGTVGLGRLVGERGNGKLIMSMGLGVVGSVYTNSSPASLQDTTPIAKLTEEADIIVVGKDSPYRNIEQLIEAWKADPRGLAVGGGSSPGGPDHLAPMLTAEALGISPKDVQYVSYDGGGELMASILGGKVAFGVSGIGETRDQIEAGELRALAVTSPERVPGIDAPTLQESGVDVSFTNWRGIVAPPGLSKQDRDKLVTMFTALHDTRQWKDALRRNGWSDAFQTGEQFGAFLSSENDRVVSVLKELGLA
ncbi:Bug family tripartite tricarboxylate transporter substrate binding protein [Prauserella muralis]|uniref:C4-dicarboxylate ABC transporter substrate-binding protein n=1 Tax=Prauserella muralis TaxID=588067 RepID=A0A2V4BLD5_9PSEU|nr:tripartite tricarboxylate transporter substrate binding protein [Prauserella muralis]PXY31433.1 C4-dicarboxylate ABC transporter substrate-binding protein [Prauserella muralis]TWE14232.1 putative tricarboxylic transport membrane protein [Prauserella muralis]